jgi:predicted enzyme related to lactoylglutathione lyase
MANPVVWFEVLGKDAKKLQGFYSDLFDWKLSKAPGPMDYFMLTEPERGIGGGIGDAKQAPGHVTVYVEVDDPQAYLDKAEQLGGKTVVGVTEIPDMVTFALFSDPEGHIVGVIKGQG